MRLNLPSPPLIPLMPFFSSKGKGNISSKKQMFLNLIDRSIRENLIYQTINDQLNKNKLAKEKTQESNSSSNESTISDEDHKSSNPNNDKKILNEKGDMNGLLKIATEEVTNYFNSFDIFIREPSYAAQYYCNLDSNVDREERETEYRKLIVKGFINNYKKILRRKDANEI